MAETPSQTETRRNRLERRRQLRDINSSVWDGVEDVYPLASVLDTSLKKNTAFIKRCRVSLNDDSQKTLLNEVATLSLEKYLTEILSALCEGFTNCKSPSDYFAGVEVSSALHQRFGAPFSAHLLSYFLQGISIPPSQQLKLLPPEQRAREDQARNDRHRIVLRVLVELWLVNVFRFASDGVEAGFDVPKWAQAKTSTGVKLPPPLAALKQVLENDLEDFSCAYIAVSLLKNYGSMLTGTSKSGSVSTAESQPAPLLMANVQEGFLTVFKAYTRALQDELTQLAREARNLEKRNENAYIRAGKILEERSSELDSLLTRFHELEGHCQTLSDHLGLEMPSYVTSSEDTHDVEITISETSFTEGLWDDEEQRSFYEDVVDLSHVAATPDESQTDASRVNDEKLLDDLDKLMNSTEDDPPLVADDGADDGKELDDSEFNPAELQDGPGDSDGIPAEETTVGVRVQELLESVAAQPSRNHIDKISLEFVPLNNKASRNRVIRFLRELSPKDQHLLPFYARLVASLDPFCKDITDGVVTNISNFLKYLQQKRKIPRLEASRALTLRFLSELIKFDLVPNHVIFYTLKWLTAPLDAVNAQNLALFLEGCGRYLTRKPKTKIPMAKMIKILEQKKSKDYIPLETRVLIDGALEYANPTPYVPVRKVHSDIDLYLRRLFYRDLAGTARGHILTMVRRMDFKDADTLRALRKIFTKIWKVKYVNLTHLAWMLHELVAYYPDFVTYCVDALMENIRRGLELNNFRENQQRVSEVKFLGHLLRYQLVNCEMVYDTIHLFVTFGHPRGWPMPNLFTPLDPLDDFFRLRLICSLLEDAEVRKLIRKDSRFNLLRVTVQYYSFTKRSLSMEMEFQLRDTFENLWPEDQMAKTLEEAVAQFQKVQSASREEVPADRADEQTGDVEDDSDVDDEGDESDNADEEASEEETDTSEMEEELQRLRREAQEEADRKQQELTRKRIAREDMKAVSEVEMEFQKLMVDRFDRRPEKKISQFDEPVPVSRQVTASVSNDTAPQAPPKKFALMTKRGNRSQLVEVNVPSNSKFAVSVAEEREKLKEEKDRIRDIVLTYQYVDDDGAPLQRVVQPELVSTRYSRMSRQRRAPTINDVKMID